MPTFFQTLNDWFICKSMAAKGPVVAILACPYARPFQETSLELFRWHGTLLAALLRVFCVTTTLEWC